MLPLNRHGFWEMWIGSLIFLLIWSILAWAGHWRWGFAILPVWIWLFAFFRDPERVVPQEPNLMVSPADGMVSDVIDIESYEYFNGEPAVRVGIFLSVFNVHVNRIPCDGVAGESIFKPGKFLNALNHAKASAENQSNTLIINDPKTGKPLCVVKQITGAIARRIFCDVKTGEPIVRGQRMGLIKFGSRTELYIPKAMNPKIQVKVGDKVSGASTIIATLGNNPS
jgi:phosphatidylserine decarboxylase